MRLHDKIVALLYFSLKSVQIVVWHFNALDVAAGGAHEVVMVVVRVNDLVALHAIKDIYLREDLIVSEKIELSIDRGFVHRGVFHRNLLKKLWS